MDPWCPRPSDLQRGLERIAPGDLPDWAEVSSNPGTSRTRQRSPGPGKPHKWWGQGGRAGGHFVQTIRFFQSLCLLVCLRFLARRAEDSPCTPRTFFHLLSSSTRSPARIPHSPLNHLRISLSPPTSLSASCALAAAKVKISTLCLGRCGPHRLLQTAMVGRSSAATAADILLLSRLGLVTLRSNHGHLHAKAAAQ